MKIRRASSSEPGAASVREHLHRAAAAKGIRGEDLVIEVVQWGLLKDGFAADGKAEDPTVAEYAERFARTPEQAQADFDEFVGAVGVEPLVFWQIEEEAPSRKCPPRRRWGTARRDLRRRRELARAAGANVELLDTASGTVAALAAE